MRKRVVKGQVFCQSLRIFYNYLPFLANITFLPHAHPNSIRNEIKFDAGFEFEIIPNKTGVSISNEFDVISSTGSRPKVW